MRDHDSQSTSAFISARRAANGGSRRELGAAVGRVVRPRQASRLGARSEERAASSETVGSQPAFVCCRLQRRGSQALQLVATVRPWPRAQQAGGVTVRETEGRCLRKIRAPTRAVPSVFLAGSCQSKTP